MPKILNRVRANASVGNNGEIVFGTLLEGYRLPAGWPLTISDGVYPYMLESGTGSGTEIGTFPAENGTLYARNTTEIYGMQAPFPNNTNGLIFSMSVTTANGVAGMSEEGNDGPAAPQRSIAIGNKAVVDDGAMNSIAIGRNSRANADNSVVVGASAEVYGPTDPDTGFYTIGSESTAIGAQSNARVEGTSMGYGANSFYKASALGHASLAYPFSIALGSETKSGHACEVIDSVSGLFIKSRTAIFWPPRGGASAPAFSSSDGSFSLFQYDVQSTNQAIIFEVFVAIYATNNPYDRNYLKLQRLDYIIERSPNSSPELSYIKTQTLTTLYSGANAPAVDVSANSEGTPRLIGADTQLVSARGIVNLTFIPWGFDPDRFDVPTGPQQPMF